MKNKIVMEESNQCYPLASTSAHVDTPAYMSYTQIMPHVIIVLNLVSYVKSMTYFLCYIVYNIDT